MAGSDTKGRRGKKLDGKTSKAVLKKVKVDIPDLGMGCPDQAEGYFATHVVAYNKLQSMMAKMQPEIQKLIKIQTKDILESLDPANIGKSREVKIRNPNFDPQEKRTDSDSKPCVGENPFWTTSYESVYDRERFRPNVIEDVKKMFLGHNKEVVQEYKEALQAVYALSDELNKQKEAMEQQESDEYANSSSDDGPLISIDYDGSSSLN